MNTNIILLIINKMIYTFIKNLRNLRSFKMVPIYTFNILA
jgi:hypothetical protein